MRGGGGNPDDVPLRRAQGRARDHPPARRGRALISRAPRAARDAGFDRASIEVDTDGPTGPHGLYERAGFTVARTEVRYTLDV
ncbi:GNAT family N-acetyltransferase [Streptomyces zhihengii]